MTELTIEGITVNVTRTIRKTISIEIKPNGIYVNAKRGVCLYEYIQPKCAGNGNNDVQQQACCLGFLAEHKVNAHSENISIAHHRQIGIAVSVIIGFRRK